MMKSLAILCAFSSLISAAENKTQRMDRVQTQRLPASGIQPQTALDAKGTLHLIYYSGDPKNGNVFYVRSTD